MTIKTNPGSSITQIDVIEQDVLTYDIMINDTDEIVASIHLSKQRGYTNACFTVENIEIIGSVLLSEHDILSAIYDISYIRGSQLPVLSIPDTDSTVEPQLNLLHQLCERFKNDKIPNELLIPLPAYRHVATPIRSSNLQYYGPLNSLLNIMTSMGFALTQVNGNLHYFQATGPVAYTTIVELQEPVGQWPKDAYHPMQPVFQVPQQAMHPQNAGQFVQYPNLQQPVRYR